MFTDKSFWRGWPLVLNAMMILLIAIAVDFLIRYGSYEYYANLFSAMPLWLINVRFVFSVVLRIIIILGSIGVLLRSRIARKLILAYSIFTILTIYWKHPYVAFKNVFEWQAANGTLPENVAANLHWYILGLMLFFYIKDILISIITIYLLRRENIAMQFIKD